MKKIFCLFVMLFILTIVNCQAETEEKVYTDQDLRKLDYDHLAPNKKPQIKSQPTVIEYRDLMLQNQTNVKRQEQIKQQIEENRIKARLQQIEIQQRQMNAQKSMAEAAEKAKTAAGAFILFFIIVPSVIWIIALISVLNNDFKGSNKMIWFLTVTFLPIIGPILYFFMGEKYKKYPYEDDLIK